MTELIVRFGNGSEEREAEISEAVQFIEAARAAGVCRLLVISWLPMTWLWLSCLARIIHARPRLDDEELIGPFLQIIVAADDEDFEAWAMRQFAMARKKRSRGVVEVVR